jgi:hypothetical protein
MKKLVSEVFTLLKLELPESVTDEEIKKLAKKHILTSVILIALGFAVYVPLTNYLAGRGSAIYEKIEKSSEAWRERGGPTLTRPGPAYWLLGIFIAPGILGYLLLNGCLYRLCFGARPSNGVVDKIGRFLGGSAFAALTLFILGLMLILIAGQLT